MIEKPTACANTTACCSHGGRCAGMTHHAYGCHLDGEPMSRRTETPPDLVRPPQSWTTYELDARTFVSLDRSVVGQGADEVEALQEAIARLEATIPMLRLHLARALIAKYGKSE